MRLSWIALWCSLFAHGNVLAAEESSYGDMVRTKLASGLSNMAFGIAEMPKNIINTSNEVNVMMGVTGGVVKGTLHTMGRMLAGMADVLTFPVPSQPITHPYYVWQQFNSDTRYGPFFDMQRNPNVIKGVSPYGVTNPDVSMPLR